MINHEIRMGYRKERVKQRKHSIDFQTAKGLWQDELRIEIKAPHPVENRSIVIGQLHGKLWTAVFTKRSDAVRIISVRRSRKKEVELYEKAKAG